MTVSKSLEDALAGIPDNVFNSEVDGDAADAIAGAGTDTGDTGDTGDEGTGDTGAEGGAESADEGAENEAEQGAEGGAESAVDTQVATTVDPRLEAMLQAAPEMADATPEQIANMVGLVNKLFSGSAAEVLDLFENHLEKIRQTAMLEAGQILPDDIKKKVDDGLITEEDGRAWAQDRAAARMSTAAAQTSTQEAQITAVQSWAGAKKVVDPDFEHKAMLVENFVSARIATTGKRPKTAAEAVALYEQGYGAVNAQLKAFVPKAPKARQEPTSSGARAPAHTAPPASLAEAMSRLSF